MIEYLTTITDFLIAVMAIVYLGVPAVLIVFGIVFYLMAKFKNKKKGKT
jgi:putative effector of murein hydrolase LrgA (UPF0299 family)